MTFNISTQLVDARNFNNLAPVIAEKLKTAAYVGFDIESTDNAHPALATWRKANKKTVFDARRTIITGFSLYAKDDDVAYYINLNHADVENRVPWEEARKLLDIRPTWVIHNSPFERRMLKCVYDWDVGEAIDSLQLAVSCFGPDEYPIDRLSEIYKWPVVDLFDDIEKAFATWEYGDELNPTQATLLGKVVGKESNAAHSYNGFVDSICYGYGLKKLAHTLLGIKTATYQETLAQAGAEHMGQLTGEQVAQYGADDSWLCVKVMEKILTMIRPEALDAFINTENPMTSIYAEMCTDGCRIDLERVREAEETETKALEAASVKLKEAVLAALPFPEKPHEKLLKHQPWYAKNWQMYRRRIENWKREDGKALNPNYYMEMRVILYDLLQLDIIYDKGKIQSDKDSRGVLLEKASGKAKTVLECFNAISAIEKRLSSYIIPYQALTDPETKRVYPVFSSMLATRRMAAENVNVMQLSKRQAASRYIRGFYLPDEPTFMTPWRLKQVHGEVSKWPAWLEQHPGFDPRYCIVSVDEKQIELCLVGEASHDRAFKEAYGQIPYKDLHARAGLAVLRTVTKQPDISLEEFKSFQRGENLNERVLIDRNRQTLEPESGYKFFRAEGKNCNFEYWFSAYLSNTGARWGMSMDETSQLTQAYAEQFPEAAAWRAEMVGLVQQQGYLDLPDGHRRVRFEATNAWQNAMAAFWSHTGSSAIRNFGNLCTKKIAKRAVNQVINARIQGTCAPIIKESMLRIRREVVPELDCRLMFPIHDEVVACVRIDDVPEYLDRVYKIMTTHPKYISELVQDSSPSVGITFQPYDNEKAPFGQIEVSEPPQLPWIKDCNRPMDGDELRATLEYLKQAA